MSFATIAVASGIRIKTGGVTPEPAPSLDPDYQAVLNYATANGIPLPSTAQQEEDLTILANYKATGAWDRDDVFFKWSGTASAAFKLICWKRRIFASAFGGLIWSTTGVKGNGTNAYINPHYNLATGTNWLAASASIMVKIVQTASAGDALCGVYTGVGADYTYLIPSASGGYIALNGTTGQDDIPHSGIGLSMVSRISNTEIVVQSETSNIGSISGITNVPQIANAEIYLMARNRSDNGNIADMFYNGELSYYSLGGKKNDLKTQIQTTLV